MTSQLDSENAVFSAGSDLWIVPERKHSPWVRKLDWLLNFQMARSGQHQSRHLPEPVVEILKNCELPGYDFIPDENSSLMIWATPYVPARWVVVIHDGGNLQSWIRAAVQKWKDLNSPSVRVFLPQGIKPASFLETWKQAGGTANAVFVPALEGKSHG